MRCDKAEAGRHKAVTQRLRKGHRVCDSIYVQCLEEADL